MARNNLITIKNAEANPIVYQGLGTEVPTPDIAILERGMANLETRINKANEEYAAVEAALGQNKDKFHQDPTTLAWANQYIEDNYLSKIRKEIEAGNFSRAGRTGIRLAGQMADDENIQNRIEDNTRLEEKKKILSTELNAGTLNQDDYNYLLAKNEDEYRNRFDSDGNYKAEYQNDIFIPTSSVKSFDWDNEIQQTFELMSPEKFSKQHTTSKFYISEDGRQGHYDMSTGASYERVLEEYLRTDLNQRINNNDEVRLSIQQDLDAKKYKLNQYKDKLNNTTDEKERIYLQNEIDRLTRLTTINGSPITNLSQYVDKCIEDHKDVIQHRAYNWETQLTNNDDKLYQKKSSGGGGGTTPSGTKSPNDTQKGNPSSTKKSTIQLKKGSSTASTVRSYDTSTRSQTSSSTSSTQSSSSNGSNNVVVSDGATI